MYFWVRVIVRDTSLYDIYDGGIIRWNLFIIDLEIEVYRGFSVDWEFLVWFYSLFVFCVFGV